MRRPDQPVQTDASVEKNVSFFRDHTASYGKDVAQLDTYRAIRTHTDAEIAGIERLLDVGNGGVFDYDVTLVKEITALDLFFDDPAARANLPASVTPMPGSALNMPFPDGSFDGVLMVMLLHHLVGTSAAASLVNVATAIREAHRVLRKGGRLVVVESCVPRWFYAFERAIFPMAAWVIHHVSRHPATLQYPVQILERVIRQCFPAVRTRRIPVGRWVLQFGHKFPSALTPVSPHLFVAERA